MAYIKGLWKWNYLIACDFMWHGEHLVNFTSNGEQFKGLYSEWITGYHYIYYIRLNNEHVLAGCNEEAYDVFPIYEAYRVMDFGFTKQSIDDTAYKFITDNAANITITNKLTLIAENEQKVFDAGKKAEYDAFWDVKQPLKDAPTSIVAEYSGRWTVERFNPKYDIVALGAQYAFYANNLQIDLVEHLRSIGKRLDFSQCTNMNSCFANSAFTHLGNVSGLGRGNYYAFQYCKNLVTIDEWGHCEGGDIAEAGLTNAFDGCTALENITIKGKIMGNIYFHWSTKLTRASIESIVSALSDNVSGKTLQLSKVAADNAFPQWIETSPGVNVNVGTELNSAWATLVASKPNWTITLV